MFSFRIQRYRSSDYCLRRAIANPADLVKGKPTLPYVHLHFTNLLIPVRMQAYYPHGNPYKNTRHAFVSVFREGVNSSTERGVPILDGLGELYKGVIPTTVRGVVLSASQICSYDQVKQTLKRNGIFEEGIKLHVTASLFAG